MAEGAKQGGIGGKLNAVFPFLGDIRAYKGRDFKADLVAAATVAVVASPQSMAYAVIAGVDPVYGLYASILPVIVAALFGSSRYLVAGPTNAISMILYSTMAQLTVAGIAAVSMPAEVRLGYMFALALLAGVIQLVMGLARLGELSNFISHSVIQAFTVGASILIVVGQLRSLFGLHFEPSSQLWRQLVDTISHLPETNFWALGIGLFTLAGAILLKKFKPKWPNTLIALAAATLLSALLDLGGKGVSLAGAIPRGLPPISLPALGWVELKALLAPALSIALLGAVETLAIARTMASQRGEMVDGNRELIGQGLGNISAGLTSGIAGCGSFGRSAVNFTAGARTRFSAAMSGIFTLGFVLLLGPLVRYLPIPALSALLLLICWNMIDFKDIRFTLRTTRNDAIVWVVTLACVLIFDLEKAVFVGVILSLILFLNREAHPQVELMGRHMMSRDEDWIVPCPYVTAFRLEGPLFFGAVSQMENSLFSLPKASTRVVILHMNRVHIMDATGAHALKGFLRRSGQRGIKVIVVWSNHDVRDTIERAGLSKGNYGCYLVGSMSAATCLASTLLLESRTCQACMGCEHGRNAVAQISPESELYEDLDPTHEVVVLPHVNLETPAKGSDTLDKPDSPTALLDLPPDQIVQIDQSNQIEPVCPASEDEDAGKTSD